MQKIFWTLLVTVILLALPFPINAQVSVNLNHNVGSQPTWGPVGYDEVRYYYLPDIESYYYVPQHRFYFYNNGRWVYSSSLPPQYSDYNLYNGYKVVVNEREPWRNHKKIKTKYVSYKGRNDQKAIRDSRDAKYFVNKNHPEHNNWVNQQTYRNDKKQSGWNENDNLKNGGKEKQKSKKTE
jgi:hypothetical protein